MKILHITPGYGGGLDKVSIDIFNFIKTKKIDQEVVHFFDYGDSYYKDFKGKKIKSINYKEEIIFVNIFKIFKNLKKSDIIHIHHTKTWILFTPFLFFKNKIIYTFHGNFGSSIKKSLFQKFIIRLIINYCTLFSNKLIFLTEDQKNNISNHTFFKKRFNKKSIIINNFIDKNTIINKRNKFPLEIIFVGRYTKIKGFDDLVSVVRDMPKINFNIIGDSDYKSNLKNLKNLGTIENKEIHKYYDKSTIFILPSYTEAFPMTILEAMARGLVILVSDIPGMREIVKEGRNGYLFPPGDIEKIKELILYLKNNPREIERISKNNLKDIHNFTADKQLPKYLNLYKGILNDKKN